MNQSEILKISITKIAPLLELINKKGINIIKLLSDIGLDSDILNSPDNKISLEKYNKLFSECASRTNDKCFGLHAGESFTKMSNILGYVMMNCLTIEEALNKYIKYQRLTEDIKVFNIIQNKNNVIIEISIIDEELDKNINLIDYNLAGFITYCHSLSGRILQPIETRFRHSNKFEKSEYERIFKSRLIFNSEKNALVFSRELMQIPILQPNKELLMFFEKYIYEINKRTMNEETYTDKVKMILLKTIKDETPSIKEISKLLSMSVRSLQNRLSNESTTYLAVLNSFRKEIALEYLKDKTISISEISFLLGFSEPSAFHRSFKKWTNATPNMFRSK